MAARQRKGKGPQGPPPPAQTSTHVFTAGDKGVTHEEKSGITVSLHPVFPEIQFVQGELFFECTLFLYSVLALFLQYLNLYKTLWWLPKSFWPYSMKFHLINPYFLSCVGLLLGLRVTKCFWKTITEMVATLADGRSPSLQNVLTIFEYAVIKTPLCTMVITSFLFSFSRVYREYPLSCILHFLFPVLAYMVVFWSELTRCASQWLPWLRKKTEFDLTTQEGRMKYARECWQSRTRSQPWKLLDTETVLHMCSDDPEQVRDEVSVLWEDAILRLKRCLFAAFSTMHLSITLPCKFIPYRSSLGLPQQLWVDSAWIYQMGAIVFCTSFSLYFCYLFPLNFLDLLHRSAVHLGMWKEKEDQSPCDAPDFSKWTGGAPLTQCTQNGVVYTAVKHAQVNSVAAIPGQQHFKLFYRTFSSPLTVINVLCTFQGVLILCQFWLLVLSTDWQHIVTLVMLMFANYLLLAKMFKDKVILGRIYNPSPEDIALHAELKAEAAKNLAK